MLIVYKYMFTNEQKLNIPSVHGGVVRLPEYLKYSFQLNVVGKNPLTFRTTGTDETIVF